MTDIILEAVRALVLLGILVFLWNAGHKRFEHFHVGWNFIISGFGLLLFGSILDITDNFENLNRFIVIGDTETEAFLEKFIGFLGGFIFLAIGLFKWIPTVQELSDLMTSRTRDLEETNKKLILEIGVRKRAEKIKQEFTSTVSHELRTPLTSIKGALGLIRSGAIEKIPVKLQSMLDIAYANSDRLVLLINDILDVEKIESGMMTFHMQPTQAVSLVEEAIKANKGYADEHGIIFVETVMEKDSLVHADKDRLMQALSNLMSNAAKYSSKGEQVELSVTRSGDTISIAVKDFGTGIPETFKNRIFEKFSQADSSDTRQRGGTGLGLSITKAIVEQHGGKIDFDSKEGVGSTFFFTLPAVELSA